MFPGHAERLALSKGLLYLSPEQIDHVSAVRGSRKAQQRVDAHADHNENEPPMVLFGFAPKAHDGRLRVTWDPVLLRFIGILQRFESLTLTLFFKSRVLLEQ